MHMHHHGERHGGPHWGWRCCGGGGRHGVNRSGNAAFDDYLAAKMVEIQAEIEAFREFRAEQRRKRDDEDFAAFRASREAGSNKPAE